jgi:hypothetical protein
MRNLPVKSGISLPNRCAPFALSVVGARVEMTGMME